MKKLFLSFAVMGMFALTACTGNAEQTTDNNDSTAVEQTEEQVAQEVPIDQQTELTCDQYTLTVPETYKASSRMVNQSCNLTYKGGQPFTTLAVDMPYQTVDEFVTKCKEGKCIQLDDVTVDGHTWKVFTYEDKADNTQEAYAATDYDGKKVIRVRALNGAHKMDAAEALAKCVENLNVGINSIKIK